MSEESVKLLGVLSNLFSVILASFALLFGILIEIRGRKRFEKQLQMQETLTNASIKPFINILSFEWENHKGVIMKNYGSGVAVITEILFVRNDSTATNMASLFKLPQNYHWDDWCNFHEKVHYLQPGETITLLELTSKNLIHQGCKQEEAINILKEWRKELEEVTIKISYQDILGNKQPEYSRKFISAEFMGASAHLFK